MSVVFKNRFEPETVLQDYPQLRDGKVYLAYQRTSEIGDYTEFGLCAYDLESLQVEYLRAPFGIDEADEDDEAEADFEGGEWRLIAEWNGRFVTQLKFESSYECHHRFFELDSNRGKWSELGEYDAHGELRIGDDGPWVSPAKDLDLKVSTLSGGDIHYWMEGDTLHVVADCTHAFDRDSSDASMSEPAYEQAQAAHPLVRTNFEFVSLADFIGYNGGMYQQALKDGTPNLPDVIPADHPVRAIDNLHDFGVGRIGKNLLFIQNDYHAGGIVGILHLLEE